MRPLHDRLVVKHITEKHGLIEVIRENPDLVNFVKQGENGDADDNRRVFLKSEVISVGCDVRGVKVGDIIKHTAWDDLPEAYRQPGYSMIREKDIAGHCA